LQEDFDYKIVLSGLVR